jgi:peptidoglycan-associated lipoprotein
VKKLLFILINALVFTIGCKKQDIKPQAQYQDIEQQERASADTPEIVDFNDEPSVRVDSYKDANLKTIYFEFDRSDLTEYSIGILKENAAYLINNPDIKIILEGHTDERGTIEYNLSLGQRRALKVKEYYTRLGIKTNRIATISYGKEKPAERENSELAWAKNRRVETKILLS